MSASSCPDQERLSAYLLGDLPEAEAGVVADHLDDCGPCEAAVQAMERRSDPLTAALRQTPAEDAFVAEPEYRRALAGLRKLRAEGLEAGGIEADGLLATETMDLGQVGQYQLLAKLGEGGMGTVYKALHVKLKKVVALKVLPADRMENQQAVARFQREMEAVGRLEHPNVVRATDAGEAGGTHFLVMECVDGVDLSKLGRHGGPLPVADACELIRQAAVGLHYAHQHGLVHRDVKPSNLMLSREGLVKILDLGLALLHRGGGYARMPYPSTAGRPVGEEVTHAGQAMGTADYMAPEQISDSHAVDIRADIYSLGCTLYRLLAGHAPFSGPKYRSSFEKMTAHLSHDVPPIRLSRSDVPQQLAAVIDRMLAKDPDDRFATPADVAGALKPLASGWNLPGLLSRVGQTAEPPIPVVRPGASTDEYRSSALVGTQSSLPTPRPAARRRSPWAIAAGLMLSVIGAILIHQVVIRITDRGETIIRVPEGTEIITINSVPGYTVKVSRRTTLRGHTNEVWSVAFAPDGKTLASAGVDKLIKLWDPATHRERREIRGHLSEVRCVAFSPDGRTLASAGADRTIRLWDVAAGREVQILKGHTDEVRSVAFSPEDGSLASAGYDRTVRLWDPATAEQRLEILAHTNRALCVAFAPDGKELASAGDDKLIKTWLAGTTYKRLKIPGHTDGVCWVTFSPDGTRLASASWDGTIKLWDRETGLKPLTLGGHEGEVRCVAFSPDGKVLASASHDETIKLWALRTGEELATIRGHTGAVTSVAFSPDGKLLASASADKTVELWDLDVRIDAPSPALPPPLPLSPQPNTLTDAELAAGWRLLFDGKTTDGWRGFQGGELPEKCRVADGSLLMEGAKYYIYTTEEFDNFELKLQWRVPPKGDGGIFFRVSERDKNPALWAPEMELLDNRVAMRRGTAGSAFGLYEAPRDAAKPVGQWNRARLLVDGSHVEHWLNGVKVVEYELGSPEFQARLQEDDFHGNTAFGKEPIGPIALQGWAGTVWYRDLKIRSLPKRAKTGPVPVRLEQPPVQARPQKTLERHAEKVTSVAFSPDGSIVASASYDDTVKLWEAATGELRETLEGHTDGVYSVTFSPDGSDLASASEDGTVKIWDPLTGELRRTLKAYTAGVTSVAFSPDGSMLAAGSWQYPDWYTVKVWDLATGQVRHRLEGHTWQVVSVAFSPDGSTLATGSFDKTVKLWDLASGQLRRTLQGHTYHVNCVAFSPDGSILASGSRDKTVKLWDMATGELKRTVQRHVRLHYVGRSLAFSPDGSILAAASGKETVKIWDVATGGLRWTMEGLTDSATCLAFSPDGLSLVSGSFDGAVRFWDLRMDRLPTAGTGPPHSEPPSAAEKQPGPETEPQQMRKGHTGPLASVAFSPDGSILASTSDENTVKLWDAATRKLRRTLRGHTLFASSVTFSPDGSLLASGSQDRTVRLWDPTTGQLRHSFNGHKHGVTSVAFSPDGSTLASGSRDKTAKLWDVATGKLLRTLEGHTDEVSSVDFSPDGSTLASGSWDGTVKLWDVTGGELRQTLQGHEAVVYCVAFSPDGSILASGSEDQMVKLWDPATGQLRRTLEGHAYHVRCIAFSPDGSTLACGDCAGAVKYWDVATGELQRTLELKTRRVESLAFSPDGSTLAIGDWDGAVKLWNPKSGAPPVEVVKPAGSQPAEGWRLLFDGKTTQGWRGYQSQDLPEGCEAVDGCLRLTSPSSDWIVTTEDFDNFELNLQWRVGPDGDGGVQFRVSEEPSDAFHSGPEMQCTDNKAPSGEAEPDCTAGSAARLYGAPRDAPKPVGQWNEAKLIADGPHIEHWLNGRRVVQYEIDSPEFRADAQDRFFQTNPDFGQRESGPIGLQGIRGTIWYRDIKIRPLPKRDETMPRDVAAVTAKLRSAVTDFTSSVSAMAFAPDGKTLVSNGLGNGKVAVVDVAAGKVVETARPHNEIIRSLAYSPDGQMVAIGTWRRATIWRTWGRMDHRYPGMGDTLDAVAISPDNKLLATASWSGGSIWLWDIEAAKTLWRLSNVDSYDALDFSPSGNRLVSCGRDHEIHFWDVATGKEVAKFSGHQDRVSSVEYSPDGTMIVSGSQDRTVRLWDVAAGRQRLALKHPNKVFAVAFSPDGRILASACADGKVRLWSARTGELLTTLDEHTGPVYRVAFSPDGTILASSGEDKTIKLWDIQVDTSSATAETAAGPPVDLLKLVKLTPGECRGRWRFEGGTLVCEAEGATVLRLPYQPPPEYRLELQVTRTAGEESFNVGLVAGNYACMTTFDGWSYQDPPGHVTVLDAIDGESLNNETRRKGLAFTNGKPSAIVCTVRQGRIVAEWDGRKVIDWRGDFSRLSLVCRHAKLGIPVRGHLFVGAWGSTYRIEKIVLTPLSGEGRKFEPLEVGPPVPPPKLVPIKIAPEPLELPEGGPLSRKALTSQPAPIDGVRCWTLETRQHRGPVRVLAYSPDGRLLATGGDDGAIRVWDAATDDLARILIGHDDHIISLSWSPDARYLASGSGDGTVRLWDVQSGLFLRTLRGHAGPVHSVDWSPDGRVLATGGADATIRLWDPSTAQRPRILRGHTTAVLSLRWSPDGRRLASGGAEDGTVRFWEPGSGSLLGEYDTRQHIVAMPNMSAKVPEEHVADIPDLCWSRDARLLWPAATCDFAWSIGSPLLDADTSKPLRTPFCVHLLGVHQGLKCLVWSPDGKALVGVRMRTTGGPQAYTWDAEAGARRQGRWMPSQLSRITGIAYSPDGKTLAVAGDSGAVYLWRPPTQFDEYRVAEPTQILSAPGITVQKQKNEGTIRISFAGKQHAEVNPAGYFRGSPGVEDQFVYVVQTEQGQETLTPGEFDRMYDWKDPDTRAAESVLEIGGTLTISVRGRHSEVRTTADLPWQEFQIIRIALSASQHVTDASLDNVWQLKGLQELRLDGAQVTDVGLANLRALPKLQALSIAGCGQVTDAGLKHIEALTALEMLWLNHTQLSDAGLEHLGGLVELWHLNLRDCPQVTDAGLEHLKQLARLQELYLGQMPLTDRGLQSLTGLKELRLLDLEGCTTVSDAGLQHLRGLTKLGHLSLNGTQVTAAGLQHLKGMTTLRRLELSGTQVTDAGLERINGLAELRHLGLDDTRISDRGLELLKGLTELDYLSLGNAKITDAGLGNIARLTNLRVLILDGTQVADAGLKHLQRLVKLEYLSLAATPVTGTGFEHLGGLTELRELNLASAKLSNDGLEPIGQLRGLKRLHIDWTSVTDDGLVQLRELKDLTELGLGGNEVPDAGLKHLKELASLADLRLDDTQVSDAGLQHLAELANLKYVNLTNTRVTDAGVKALQEALPNCKIVR